MRNKPNLFATVGIKCLNRVFHENIFFSVGRLVSLRVSGRYSDAYPQLYGSNNKECNHHVIIVVMNIQCLHFSRCHLLQTSTSNLLVLRPCGTRPPLPCRDPQSHRGGHKPDEGFPDRASGSDHGEGAFVIPTGIWTCLQIINTPSQT